MVLCGSCALLLLCGCHRSLLDWRRAPRLHAARHFPQASAAVIQEVDLSGGRPGTIGRIPGDYEPTIFYPKRSVDSLYKDLTIQCEKMDIPFLSYLPTEVQLINDAYNLVVDALLGVEEDTVELKEPWATILTTIKQIKIPIISLDIPSGWDVEAGNSEGINPEVLISLSAPKTCALHFAGKHHFIAGRFLPYDIQKKFDLNLPKFPGTECVMEL